MSFRQNVRCKLLALCLGSGVDPRAVVHAPPRAPDSLDQTILGLAARTLYGAQLKAFYLRYWGDESDQRDRERMESAYSITIFGQAPQESYDFAVIARNAQRALDRLVSLVSKPTSEIDHRKAIRKGWEDAQRNA